MKVAECCTSHVVTADPEATLADVARLMRGQHVGTVVIVDASRNPVGILTDRDIVLEAVACDLDARALKAVEVMSQPVTVIGEEEDANWALKVMRDRGVRRLPVVKGSGALAGVIALDDLLETTTTALYDVVQAIGTEAVTEARRRQAA